MIGIFLLCGGIQGFGRGDLLSLISAVLYAAWMIELGHHMQKFGKSVHTACTQFLVMAAIALPIGALWGSLSPAAAFAAAPQLFVLGAGSTALAFGLQTVALRYTTASHAAVIVSAEGVFGAMAAALSLGERVSLMALCGAALIMAGITYLALDKPFRHRPVRRALVEQPVAEAVGFEPTVGFPPRWFSRPEP